MGRSDSQRLAGSQHETDRLQRRRWPRRLFKLAIRRVADRWYLYTGHEWHRGWTILDVTDAANPKLVKFVPGPDNTNTIQMEFHDNIMVTALQRKQPTWGGDPNRPHEEGALICDISDPVNWKQLSHWKTGAIGVHRIGYPGGKYANLAATMPGFRRQILVFLDISDPKNPKEAGRWWMPGQKEGEQPARNDISFHGPAIISDDGKTAYVGYGPAVVILDISDIAQPKLVGQLNVTPPFASANPAHDVLPIPGKNLLYVHGEATGGGDEPNDAPACSSAGHIRDGRYQGPIKPRLVSIFPRRCRRRRARIRISATRVVASAPTIPTLNTICPTSKSRAISSTSLTSMPDCAFTTSRIRICRLKSDGSFHRPRPDVMALCPTTNS